MKSSIEIQGVEEGTLIDVEVCNGVIEVMTDDDKQCCVAITKLTKQKAAALIGALNLAIEELGIE